MTRLRRQWCTRQDGWSLLELVVVVGLLAFIAGLAGPRLLKAIERANKAPGEADMAFLQAAMERFELDNARYPWANTGANTASDIMTQMHGGYVRSTTTFRNGYKQGYLYLTSTNGTVAYYLVDLAGADTATVTATCGAQVRTFTVQTGETAGLTPPDQPAVGNRWVPTNLIANCTFAPSGLNVYKGTP